MDRISRKQRQLERKYDNLRRYAAEEEKYKTTTSTSSSSKTTLSQLSLSQSTTARSSSAKAGTSEGGEQTMEQQSSSTFRGTEASTQGLHRAPSTADARSVSADPIKRYHKDPSGGESLRSYPVVIAIQDYLPEPGKSPEEALPLDQGQIVEVLDNKNPASWLVRTKAQPPQTGWVPGSYFETPSKYYTQRRTTRELMGVGEDVSAQQQALMKREQVYTEMLKTEEEFCMELRLAIDHFVKALESEEAPAEAKDHKAQLALNLPALHNFHANVLLKGLQYYSDDPGKVGQTFVRLERDFEQHVVFMRELESTLRMVQEVHSIGQFLEEIKSKSGQVLRPFTEYLQLIPERVAKYEGFFREIIKYSTRAEQNTDIMQKALELVQSMPKRAKEIEFTKNILNYPGDTRRLGRIYRHELFQVWESDEGEPTEKYVFLFKNKMMLTDRDNRPDPPLFKHYSTIRVDKYTVRQHTVEGETIVFRPNEPGLPTFRMKAKDFESQEFVRKAWIKDIVEMQQTIAAALAADDDSLSLSLAPDMASHLEQQIQQSQMGIPRGETPLQRRESSVLTVVPATPADVDLTTTSRKTSSAQFLGPEEGPPRKKVKSPPGISPTGSSTSLYSGGSSSIEWQTTGTSLEMQGTRVTRTQYGFRTLQESSAKMCLKVTGFPLPDITWYKDSVLIKEDERHTFYSDEDGYFALTIDPVKTDDTGRYTCVATNEYGQASTSAFFRVLKMEKESAPPSFKSQLQEQNCKEGDVVDFECQVDGWPEPEIIWLVDDQPLRPSHDFRIQYDGQLTKLEIRDAQPDDTGTYAVKITNEYGTAESKCRLNVQPDPDKNHVPPEFQAVIEDVDCNEGDTVKFKAILTGDPDPEVIWYVNGVPLSQSEKIKFISEDGICILTIQDVSRHFDGTVTCQGKNRLGSGSCEARLRVRVPPVPPQFERPLEDRLITENGAVMFEVDVIGYPEPKVEFFLKGRPLINGQDGVEIRQLEGNYRVTIQNCQIEKHDGEIMTKAINEHGQAESRARLTVEQEEEESRCAPTFIKDIEDQTVKHGQDATFDTVVRGTPVPAVNWFLNGQKLDAQTPGIVSIQANGIEHKIVLNSANCAGMVLCRAENSIGRFETKARLIVLPAEKQKHAPVFRQPLLDKAETEGASTVFEVTVDAEPAAQFRWTLNGQELRESDRIHFREFEGSSKLEMDQCRIEDGGIIECTAMNSEGQAVSSAKFTVNRKPKAPEFDKKPGTVQVEKGEQAVFEAHADAMPPPEYQWSIGGRRVFPSTDGARIELNEPAGICRLVVDTNKISESAPIVVNVANNLGSDECSGRLIVVEPLPVPPFKKSRLSEEESSESQITQLQNLPGGEAAKMGEFAGDEGPFGRAEPMEGVEFQQGPPGIPAFKKGLEQVLECQPGEELVAEVKVDGAQKVKWFKDGQPLEDGKNGVRIEENIPEGISRLHIPNIQPGENGRIRVEAENENGKSASEAQIRAGPVPTIKVDEAGPGAPKFEQQVQNANVNEGDSVELKTVVTGDPPPSVRWLLNDKVVETGEENMQIGQQPGGVHTLRIDQANPAKHSGRVLAQAENTQGRAESAADISVKPKPGPPYFSREPQDHEVTDEEESVKFSAIVHGDPVPTVYWYLKDEMLVTSDSVRVKHEAGTGKTSIRLVRPKIEDSGEVRVRAENMHGQAQASAKLSVSKKGELPRFLTDMDDRQVNERSNVKFVAKIEGVPEPEVQWTLNGEPIAGDNVRISKEGNAHCLEITGALPSQSGEIACTAKNSAGSKRQNVQLMVKECGFGPTFARNLTDCLVEENQTLVMEAQLSEGAKPKPTVKWLRDGKELAGDDDHLKLTESEDGLTHKMTVLRAQPGDKGRITLQAENQFGKAETSASVGVQKRFSQKKPQFLSELGPITITEGDTLTAKVIITGDPKPYTKWYINNQMVYQTEDTEMKDEAGVYTLVIHGCTRDMTGKIKCIAGNKMGEATIEGKLTVVAPVPVEFETGLCDATCREGDTLRLKAVLLGEPMPEVTWFINGKKLVEGQNIKIHADQGTYTVTIKNITQDYSGLVVCEAVNEFGKASSQATLKVLPRGEPPDFLEWLSNVRARQGSEVVHKVVYTGDPRPVISWFINNQQIQSSDEISIVTTENTSTLTIRSFNPEKHVGEIICKAENDAGEVSCTANMASYTSDMFTESESGSQVEEEEKETFRTPTPIMAPAFITKIKDARAQRGHQAIFECVVPDTKGVCCKWLHDGKEIELIARIRVQMQTIEGFTTSELVIDEVEPEDAGKYTVIVANAAGMAECEAKLEVVETLDKPVQKAPEFTVNLADKVVPLREKVTFECKVTGLPEPQITWFKGDQKLEDKPEEGIQITNEKGVQRLVIEAVENVHEGKYVCVAENIVGKAETAGNLRVETMAPEFTRPLSDQQAQVGGQVVLECSVRGIPQPNVEFFTVHDNFRIQSGTRVSIQHDESNTHWRMVIKDVQQNDFRQYRAVAKNEFGQAQTEAKVTEQESGLERPRIIEPLKRQKVKEGETVEMGVKVAGAGRPGQQPPEVEWFKNGEPLQPDGDRVKLVEYRDTGEFKLVIRDARAEDAGEYGIRISNKAGQDSSQAQLAVEMEETQKPEFTQPLRDTNIKELETSTLAVTVTGIPQPEVQWFKDGQPVQIDGVHLVRQDNPEAGQHSLTINQARVEDAGLFTCKAANKAGEAESRARFGVQEDLEPPKFTEGLKPMQIKEKETATMSVQVEGKPEPEIHWYKDGRPVQIDQVRIVAKDEEHGRHSLTVNDALLIDAGQYSVKAINKAGQAETEAKFGVQELLEAPKFTEGLKPLEVKEGESATMSVAVSGMPAPEIQWYKDGQPVEIDGVHVARQDDGQGHHSLVIKDAKLRDAGSYTCQAKNKAGQCVTQAKFGVIEDVEMPKFTDGLKPVEVKEGESAQMAVAVEGKPEPQVQWYKDGRPVQIDNVHVVAKDDGQGHHSLMVKDANMADAGTYTCKAVNKGGQAESEAKVGVVEDLAAPEFTKGLEPVEINEGETAQMSVEVEGKPLPQVQWFKDGQPVQIDGTHLVAQDDGHGHHSLTVKDAKLVDAGTYSCKAVNKAGSAETRANFAVIEELEAPKFVDGLKPVEVKEGETAKMSVEVEGKPEPEVSWYKDERPVQMDNVHVVAKEEGKGQHSLTVKDANLADAGTYSAKAVNKVGEAETKANFGVIEDVEAPKFVDGLKPVEVKEGETAKMSVTVEGKPEPQVQWYKDGRPVQIDNVHIEAQDDGQGHHSLTVKDAILGDAGTYTCKAVNKGGQAESEAKFAVIEDVEAPHFIEPLKEQEVHPGQESVAMECTVQGKPEPEVKWTRNGEPIQMDGQHAFAKKDAQGHHTLVIPNPQKADAGVYRCEAVNKAGRDETSAQLKYPTEMEVDQPKEEQVKPIFTRELEPKTVKEGEPVEMSCQVNAKESKPEIRWFRDDKPIQPGQEPNIQIEQSEDGTLRLKILHATKAEVGVYRCEAINPVGRAETSAPLKYAEQLPIEQPEEEHEALLAWRRPLQDKQVPKGTRGVVLECQLEPGAMRGVRVDWLKDGAILSNKMDQYRLKVEQQSDGTQRLLFDTAEFEHIGVYRCVATDSSGNQIWTEARLGVIAPRDSEEVAPGPPEFVELLKSATTTIGGTVVLRCKVRGNPRPTITWSRQGYGPVTITDRISLEYHEDGTIILTLKNAEMDDTGEYRCDAENEYGTAWTEGPIIVAAEGSLPTEGEAPDFVEPVRPITIKQGETGVLEGKITGLPFPEVKWYKGEQPIVPGENPRYKIESLPDGTQRLIVSNAQMSDMDDYRCEASNKYGDVWSDVTLTVQIPSPEESLVGAPVPPTFVKGLQEVHANEGEPAVLECVVKGEPKPQIKWFKDGQEIEPDNMHFKQTQEPDGTCRLSIPAARITDAGTFRCEAINPSGSARTEGPLRVHLIEEAPMGEEAPMEEAAPALAEEMKPAQAREGEEAPTPMEVAPMMEAPAFLQDLRPVQAKEGDEAVFECKVGGEPKPDIKWYKDGRELGPEDGVMESMPDGTQRLRLPNVGPDDEGIYECAATNPAGTVRSQAPLSVIPEEKPEAVGKPEIVKGLQPVTVRPGEPAQFEVQVRGPVRTVKWYKNGKEMENPKTEEDGQGCFRLIIPSAGPDDEAEYKVVVANPAGEADSSAPLTLLKPLGFVKGLEDQSVPKGQKAVLEVETNRAPRLVKWYKNGEELKPGQAKAEPKQISDTKFRLEIPDADEEDAADYSVRVFDREDEPGAESSCKLTVLLPAEPKAEQPGFEQPLREQTIPEEDELVLEVKTHGKPHTVKWYKNGEELKPSDRIKMEQIGPDHFRLVIPSAKQDDSGNYAVEIINDAGKAKCDAQQTVEPVPEFIRPLQDVEVAEGERAEFWCETNLRSVPRVVKWFKNGQELRANERIEIRTEPNGIFRLVIRSAVKEDIGTYKILLENTAGKAESQANLGVRSAAQQPGFEQPLKEQTIPEEDQLVLEVKTFGKPHTVKWYKNGEELKPTDRIRMEKLGPDHFRLVIPSAMQDDSGNYAVEIINDAGKAKCDAQQIVEPIPEFIKPLQDLEVEEGQRAEFWCETNLRNVARVVKWFKNGQEIRPDDRIEIGVEANNGIFRLVIKSAVKDDIGTYKILLENTAGKAESQANLGVRSAKKLEPPKIVKALMDQIVAEGDELTFEVQVQGDVDEIKWLKDGFPLSKDARIKMEKIDDQTYRLTIPSAVLADAGEFEVQAINAAGKAVSSAHAEVDQAPRIVQGLVPAEIDEGDEHLFRVEASAPIRTVKWFKNGEEIKAPPGARIKLIDVSPKKYELLIDKAQLDDGATYRVVLANKAGQCESQADLKVRRPEVFKLRKGLEDVTIDEGQPLELVAELDGQPASVIWLKNGVEVVPDDRIKISANPETGVYSLQIPSAVAADGGAYRVVFANPKGGEVSSGSVAHVRAKKPAAETSPAIFLTPLEDVELPEGETLNLKCRVGGLPLPDVKWFRNGEEVKPDDRIAIRLGLDGTATLRIREVRKGEDAGQFKAEATNEAGQAETQCQVTVKSAEELPSPPKFVIPLKRTEGTPGQKAEFNVKVRGVPMPTLEWILNGVPIDFAANPRFQLEDMSDGHWTMTIKDVQESDFGTLRCIARNEHGQDQCEAPFAPAAEPAEKKKAEPEGYPPRFNVPLWDRRVPEGPPMSIECHVDAKPTAEIEWFFKGQPLKESEEIEILNTSDGACRVRIRNFRKEHVGEYRCEAKNPYGVTDTRANYNVEVEEPKEEEKKREFAPKFNPGLEDKQLNAGETLKLFCRVEAVPPASITFYKDGVPIRGTDRIQVDYDVDSGECHLTIGDCTLDDAGAYRCVAQNVHGSTNTACQVGVKAKKEEAKKEGAEPFFTRGLVDQYVDRGATMVFTCAVTGDPEPEIKWFRNGLPLKPTNRISIEQLPGGECKLTIQDCSMTDEGIYRCEATNPLGTAKTQATGHVEVSKKLEKPKMEEGEPPRFIIPLEDCTLFVGSTVELECKVTGVPMPTVKWSKDGRPLLEDGRFEWENKPEQGHYRLRIREANRMDEGTYRCVATNDSGQASTKAFVKVDEGIEARAAPADQARPPVISVKLADQRVMEGQPLKLHCRVEGDPTPELVWYKDGEQVRPSDRIQLERDAQGNAYLIIPKCTMDDDGVYRVIATNPHGSAYDKCTVTVKKAAADEGPIAPEGVEFDATRAPKLLEPLQNVKVNEKEPVKLRCRFGWRSGDPKPAIKWYKDGDRLFPYDHVEIPEITDDGYCDLSIPESVRSDAGNYRCVAENKFGSARTACEVQVVRDKKPKDLEEQLKEMGRAPGFTIPLTVKHAKPGDTVVFECLPYGKPFPDIKWLKDGVELVPGDGLKIEADPDGTQRLILDNVDFPAEGYYRCVATNEYGTASTRAELKLHGVREAPKRAAEEDLGPQESKPRIRPGLYNQSIHQGSPVEMQIAALGYPTPTVEWLKDGKPITAAGGPDSRISIFQDDRGLHHLVIVNCQPEDEGDYSVVAKNPLGEAVSTGTLSVIRPREVEGVDDEGRGGMPFPPGFIRQLKNKHVFTKMPTIFDCLVVGYPPPEVDWYHNGKKITPGGRFKIQVAGGGSHALLITDTCVEDAGEYVAIARNCHGTAQSSAILDVTVPFLDKIKFDGTEDVTPYLTEEYGFKKQKYKSIPTPPDRGPFIKEVTGHYLTLSWIPTKRSPPRYPQVTYVIEFRELPNRDWQLLDYNIPEPVCKVRNLELGKSYQFRVRAENIYGISDPSPPSPPSRLMAPPPPVLDKFKRVIPILDPYAERALEMAHAEQYACTPWFAPGCQEKRFVAENDHTSISLHFNGYPDPKITWKHRGMDVDANSPTSNIRVSSHAGAETTITFLGFGRANVGQYTCVAENQYGKAEQNLLIEIATRPKFVQGLSNREFPSDRPLRLDVRIEGNPVPVVKWMKDWRPMAESSRIHFLQDDSQLRSLLIDQPIWSDAGIYSCVALNDAGQAVTSCTITIEAENDFLKDLKIREVRKAIKLERSPFKNIYDIAEAEEEEYSASDSVKNGSVQNGSIKNGV